MPQFNDLEASLDEGRPLVLYSFSTNARRWDFTAGPTPVVSLDGRVWQPAAIMDDGIKQSGEAATDALTITAPTNIAPIQLFMLSPPSEPMAIGIYFMHVGANIPIAVYSGDVSQVDFPQPGIARLTCETVSASMRRQGLRLAWQRACTHVLFDPTTCKVDKTAYAVSVTVSAIVGATITVEGLGGPPDGLYDGGFVEWVHPVKGLDALTIETHVLNEFTMFGSVADLFVGMALTAYRGCALTPEACQSFSNYANYGGVPALPGKSPFSSDPLF